MTPTPPPWYTPTPLGTSGLTMTPVVQFGNAGNQIAEGIVQGYQTVNAHGFLNMFWLIIVVIILLLALWIVIQRLQRL
jgi:hypothetical protein